LNGGTVSISYHRFKFHDQWLSEFLFKCQSDFSLRAAERPINFEFLKDFLRCNIWYRISLSWQ
jgi:hypothetical protein